MGVSEEDAIRSFLRWISERGIVLCEWREKGDNGEPFFLYSDKPPYEEMMAGLWDRTKGSPQGKFYRDNPDRREWDAGHVPAATTTPELLWDQLIGQYIKE